MTAFKQKSMKLNMILNAIKGLLSILFPLISFPYVSKILGVENIGRYNFASSVISYFILFAGLGISTYAIREGARVRDDEEKFQRFASEMFTINSASTIAAYILLVIFLIIVPKFHEYLGLLVILSLQIAFKTVGIEWLYSIYEDYAYITIRSIIFHIISIVLLFLLVKTESDVCVYAGITVFSSVGSNVLNYVHARKYCRVRIVSKVDWKRHMRPILILFGMSVTTTIYVSSDTTILGFLCNDSTVGVYSVSTKVYSIIKTILSSVLIVSIPRLSAILGRNKMHDFSEAASDIYSTLLTVVVPAILGIILLRKEIVLIISNENYLRATSSLAILGVALFFCLGAWFWGQCILVPMKMETVVFRVTVVSAVVNIVLNFILIPFWAENAAAITTLIAEGISFAWCWFKGKKYISMTGILGVFIKIVCGCLGIIAVFILLGGIRGHLVMYTILVVLTSAIVYFLIELLLKNQAVYSILEGIKNKINHRRI